MSDETLPPMTAVLGDAQTNLNGTALNCVERNTGMTNNQLYHTLITRSNNYISVVLKHNGSNNSTLGVAIISGDK